MHNVFAYLPSACDLRTLRRIQFCSFPFYPIMISFFITIALLFFFVLFFVFLGGGGGVCIFLPW